MQKPGYAWDVDKRVPFGTAMVPLPIGLASYRLLILETVFDSGLYVRWPSSGKS